MTTKAPPVPVPIHLDGDCTLSAHCQVLVEHAHQQLTSGPYTHGVSLLEMPAMPGDYLATIRTARKRAWRCERRGYVFGEIDRSQYAADVFAINTSMPERQGRPMSAGYRAPVAFSPLPFYACRRHAIRTYGVLNPDGHLVAYTWIRRVGDLVHISQLLGHADHLANDVMFLLMVRALGEEIIWGHDTLTDRRRSVAFYNRHDSGTDGLRYFKERLGFVEHTADWRLT